MESNFWELGSYRICCNLFSFNYRITKFFIFIKDPSWMFSITFLFRFSVSRLIHFAKLSPVICFIWFSWSSTFFKASPRFGICFNLLLLRFKISKLFILSRLGQYSIMFSEKLIYTKLLAAPIYSGKWTSLFRLRSSDFKFSNPTIHFPISFTKLFLILKTCTSAKATIPSGTNAISLLERSIFVMGLHSHQFWSSSFEASILKICSGNCWIYWPT